MYPAAVLANPKSVFLVASLLLLRRFSLTSAGQHVESSHKPSDRENRHNTVHLSSERRGAAPLKG